MTNKNFACRRRSDRQRGVSLIMVMLILVVVSLLGIGGIQVSMMAERSSRNDRDQQLAWQSAEAALVDADIDMFGAAAGTGAIAPRRAKFDGQTEFAKGCGNSGDSIGLCGPDPLNLLSKPSWLTADFTDTSTSAPTAAYGAFTTRTFASGGAGIQPAQAPRYIIETLPETGPGAKGSRFVYRVTAMGFGPRADIQAVVQMIFRN